MAAADTPPPGAGKAIRDGLADLAGGDQRFFELHADAGVTDPIALYTIDTGRLGDTPDMDSLVQVGWRSVLHRPFGTPAFADAAGSGDDLRFARLVSGPRAEAMVAAGEKAQSRAIEGVHTLRVVESPRLKVAALWLDGPEPVFVPFAGLAPEPIGESAFLAAVATVASQAAEQAQSFELGEAAAQAPPAIAAKQTAEVSTPEPPTERRRRPNILFGFALATTAATLDTANLVFNAVLALGRRLRDARERARIESDQDDDGPTASSG